MITTSLFIGFVYCLLFSLCLSQAKRANRIAKERDALRQELHRWAAPLVQIPRGTNMVPIGLDMTVSTN